MMEKSVSAKVVPENPKDPKTGKSIEQRMLFKIPAIKAPKKAPRFPPVALPNTAAVPPIKKLCNKVGTMTVMPNCKKIKKAIS